MSPALFQRHIKTALSFKVKFLSINTANISKDSLNRPALKPQDMPTKLSLSGNLLVQTLVKLHTFYYLRLNNFFLLQVSSGRVGVGMSVHPLSSLVLRMRLHKEGSS